MKVKLNWNKNQQNKKLVLQNDKQNRDKLLARLRKENIQINKIRNQKRGIITASTEILKII